MRSSHKARLASTNKNILPLQKSGGDENVPPPNIKDERVSAAEGKMRGEMWIRGSDAPQTPLHSSPSVIKLDCGSVKPDISAGKRLPFTDSDLCVTPGKTRLRPSCENSLVNPERSSLGVCRSSEKGSALRPGSSAKRGFTEVDKSPEQAEIRAKKSTAEYKRCFPVPESDSTLHTGLTGIFSAVGLGNGRGIPKQSSPSKVAKNLLCELEEPSENLSIYGLSSSPPEMRRSLSLDSDNSVHEMSVIATTPPPRAETEALASSFEDESETSADTEAPRASASQRHHEGERHLHVASSSLLRSPLFLKPKNVVVFRSYCSSINRSSLSYGSRLSLASTDGMDASTSTSFQTAPAANTPVQKKRPSLNSSLYQVHPRGRIRGSKHIR